MIKYSCDICGTIEDADHKNETIKQLAGKRNQSQARHEIRLTASWEGVRTGYSKDESEFAAHICLLCRIQMLEKLVAGMKDQVTTKTT